MYLFPRRIHFVGIGGAGMSALAEILKCHGHYVTGSDCRCSPMTRRLESLGIGVQYDHAPLLVTDADLLVYSSAVRPDNSERRYALRHGIVTARRAEILGDLMRAKFSVGVAGTHGKTTTTSLIGQVLDYAGLDPTVVVGGTLRARGSNAVVGQGEVLVAEADEYDRSFLSMFPSVAVITNIEADHLDCYRDIDDIRKAFREYAKRVPFYGALVACADDPGACETVSRIEKVCVTYATDTDADYTARGIQSAGDVSRFIVECRGRTLGTVDVPLVGKHNVRNTLAAIAVCCEMGVKFDVVCEGLRSFSGIRRRFEHVGVENGVTVIDDYAHHPSEITATLQAARESGTGRIIAVFQPHLYSRTRDFMSRFASSLMAADVAVVTEIYRAREDPIPGVSGQGIVEMMRESGHAHAEFVATTHGAVAVLVPELRSGDTVILMGAGDICDVSLQILRKMRHG